MEHYASVSPAKTGTPVSLLKFNNNRPSVGSLSVIRWTSSQPSVSPQVRSEAFKHPRSPKIKLKYLKGIFPAADETFLLDVLSSCDNNVQTASEKMLRKGFLRTPPPKPASNKWFEIKSVIEKRQQIINQQNLTNACHQSLEESLESPFPTPMLRSVRPHITAEEKGKYTEYLSKQFPSLPDRFISWALEASNFDQERAETLLHEVGPQTPEQINSFVTGHPSLNTSEGKKNKVVDKLKAPSCLPQFIPNYATKHGDSAETPDSGYFELDLKFRQKNFINFLLPRKLEKIQTCNKIILAAKGQIRVLAKGSNPGLIENSYIQTIGPGLHTIGPNPALRQLPKYEARGPDSSLAKGSLWSRAKHL